MQSNNIELFSFYYLLSPIIRAVATFHIMILIMKGLISTLLNDGIAIIGLLLAHLASFMSLT